MKCYITIELLCWIYRRWWTNLSLKNRYIKSKGIRTQNTETAEVQGQIAAAESQPPIHSWSHIMTRGASAAERATLRARYTGPARGGAGRTHEISGLRGSPPHAFSPNWANHVRWADYRSERVRGASRAFHWLSPSRCAAGACMCTCANDTRGIKR